MDSNIVVSQREGSFTFRRDADEAGLRKSEVALRGDLVATKVVRLVQRGRSEMSAEQRFLFGNSFHAMVPEPSVLYSTPETREAIRKALVATGTDAAVLFDAGRLDEGTILKCLGAEEHADGGEERAITGERLVKGEHTLFGGTPSLLTKGGGAAIVRKAYGEWLNADGTADLKKATAELDELIRNMEGRR